MFITGAKWTQTDATAQFPLGQIGSDRNGKMYKYVQYNSGAGSIAAVANKMTYYYAPSGASAGSYTVVTSDLSDSANVGAGMLVSAPATTEYCWIQIKGPATLNLALTAGADGNALTPVGSTDGALDVSALVTDHVCAYAIDASAKIVMLDCPF